MPFSERALLEKDPLILKALFQSLLNFIRKELKNEMNMFRSIFSTYLPFEKLTHFITFPLQILQFEKLIL